MDSGSEGGSEQRRWRAEQRRARDVKTKQHTAPTQASTAFLLLHPLILPPPPFPNARPRPNPTFSCSSFPPGTLGAFPFSTVSNRSEFVLGISPIGLGHSGKNEASRGVGGAEQDSKDEAEERRRWRVAMSVEVG